MSIKSILPDSCQNWKKKKFHPLCYITKLNAENQVLTTSFIFILNAVNELLDHNFADPYCQPSTESIFSLSQDSITHRLPLGCEETRSCQLPSNAPEDEGERQEVDKMFYSFALLPYIFSKSLV